MAPCLVNGVFLAGKIEQQGETRCADFIASLEDANRHLLESEDVGAVQAALAVYDLEAVGATGPHDQRYENSFALNRGDSPSLAG